MATVGIISIGEMGLGIGQLLKAQGFRVVTNATDRSERTKSRARSAQIELLPTDTDLVQECEYILSIVPPRDALSTAQRIFTAAQASGKKTPLYYLDLNAISPRTARQTETLFEANPNLKLVDGGIIGGVPYPKALVEDGGVEWHCPSLIVSGPYYLPNPKLINILNIHHLNKTVGAATGLKMCFAITTKGFVSLAIESFTTAHKLGILSDLQTYLGKYNPATLKLAESGLVTMPPKAYRWIHEMLEVAETLADDGGFDRELFQGVAEVYRVVAEDSDLGLEKPGARVRGKTVQDVVERLSQGMEAKKLKVEESK
ncbi:6-phosphogluconate dehydrogenase [Bisporella sp. PMI_857]|nr:6-phosphogluconate dehydrogenase [Bisporella sp. PMI_857]